MTVDEALAIVDQLIHPRRLTVLQEMIFRECWANKTYQDIAQKTAYDPDYIRVVGSKLWQTLSEVCQEKVTKNNFRSVLRQQSVKGVTSNISLELPNGFVPPNSPFYIPRPPIEENCLKEIVKPAALIRIKAPKNFGKTSLLEWLVAHISSDYYTVKLDLRQVDAEILANFNRLLRWLCANICFQLNIKNSIDEYWDEDLGVKVSCTTYLQAHILEQLDKPVILALDQLDLIFEHTEVAQEFLPLLRFWHEEGNNLSIWQKLRLIVVQSTESYVAIDYNQSPFNVGLPVQLPEFTPAQMAMLADRHQLQDLNQTDSKGLATLMELIGGHPFLARLAFYHLARHNLSLEELIAEAATETSIYI
ncbi:MAG: hypothetical protein D6756_04475, partial [Cyanobacteria bacterium J083]